MKVRVLVYPNQHKTVFICHDYLVGLDFSSHSDSFILAANLIFPAVHLTFLIYVVDGECFLE